METYDKKKIGRCIAWGGEHIVFEYGDAEVIKFSVFDRLLWRSISRVKASRDVEIAKTAFGPYFLDTYLLESRGTHHVAKVQRKLSGRALRRADLVDPAIAKQLSEILERHEILKSEHAQDIDLLGIQGMLGGYLSNIFLTDDRKLFIIDALLLSVPDAPIVELLFYIPLRVALWRQNQIIRNMVG